MTDETGTASQTEEFTRLQEDDYTASTGWEGVKRNDWVLASNGKTATAIDSAGFFHNEIILNIGKEKLSKATVNDVEQLVVESAV